MYFPTLLQIAKFYNVFLILGPIALVISLQAWKEFFTTKYDDYDSYTPISLLFKGVIFLVLGVAFTWGAYWALTGALRMEINPDHISEIRIERISAQYGLSDGKLVVIDDSNIIAEGFRTLAMADTYARNHSSLSDGYRIQIKLVGEDTYSDRYISAHRFTYSGQPVNVVIPHLGSHGNSIGEYSSTPFHAWIHKYVDPLFN